MFVRRGIYRHCASQLYRMRLGYVQVRPRHVGMHTVRTWQILYGRDGHVGYDVSELPRPFVFAAWLRTRHSVSVRRRLHRPRRRNVRAVRRRNIQDAARVDRVCTVRGGHAFCVGGRAHGLDVCGVCGGHLFCVGGRAHALDVCGVRRGHVFCVGGCRPKIDVHKVRSGHVFCVGGRYHAIDVRVVSGEFQLSIGQFRLD